MSIALADCADDKAWGPNGFNFTFIKVAWNVIKEGFCRFFFEFHQRGRLNREINATCLCLIPKVPIPVRLKDFRHISLVRCVYKLLSKVLANRLRRVFHGIISSFQGAFVRDR